MKSVDVQVIDVTGHDFRMLSQGEAVVYHEIVIQVGVFQITAYYMKDVQLSPGDLLRVYIWQITNCWMAFNKCAILLKFFKQITDLDFLPSDYMPVKLSGQLLKSKNQVKVVGYTKKKVFSSAVRLDNGRGKAFSILLVGFNEMADALYAIEDGSEIVVSGQLLLAKRTCDYEIHLTFIEKGVKKYEG